MGIASRAAFTLLPAAALALLLWALGTFELPQVWRTPWVPSLGIDLAFRFDGLSALMLLLITGVGTGVFIYAGGYLAGHPHQRRLYGALTAFMLAMIGCVTADDLFVLFLFWEMTSLTSFLLVGFNHHDQQSRKSAQQALLVTGSGGLAMFAGFVLLAQAFGTSSISVIIAAAPAAEATPALTAAVALVLVGAFTKSAQVPFHFWLPNAMAAPTPVSAYLHSATMVKLGVYLVARLDPAFGAWPWWQWTLQAVGALTAGWAMVLALRERDLKRILAWSTVATLGTLVLLVGLPGAGATAAVAALLLAHALYKAPLFFVAGNVDHEAGTRIIDRLGNLRRAMPWTATAALLAGLSMAGIPLTFGFVAKDAIHSAKAAEELLPLVQIGYAVFGAIAVAVAGVAAVRIFWSHRGMKELPKAHEAPLALVLPPLVLAVVGVVLGAVPSLSRPLVLAAAEAMRPGGAVGTAGAIDGAFDHALDHALEPAFDLVSMVGTLATTLLIGALVYAFWDPLHRAFDRVAGRLDWLGSAAQYARILKGIPRFAAFLTRGLQHGRLPNYSVVLLLAAAAFLIGAILVGGGLVGGGMFGGAFAKGGLALPEWTTPSAGVTGACLLIALGALLAGVFEQRLAMILCAGIVGFGSALFFLFAGAPDVAFTQFTVETVFVIVVASVLLKLKRLGRATSIRDPRNRPGALLASLAFASAATLVFLVTGADPIDPSLSAYFSERSVPDANGRNIVNVILVDFRALDTLGESTVVMLSFLATAPVLLSLRLARGGDDGKGRGS
jgi:multicomponent Na+:H+ antiporter subunit A